MPYVNPNYQTKKALKEAVKAGDRVTVFQPGGVFDLTVRNGRVNVEGPHYPQPHRWYAVVEVDTDNVVTRVVQ
jgi:hypothetical protein